MIQRILALLGPATRLVPVAVVALTVSVAESHAARPEIGVWFDSSGDGAVEIYICEDNPNRLCGRIVWLKDPLNAQGVPKHDRYNPKPEHQGRPICGLPVLGNLGLMRDGSFDGGWIYDPKAGKSYSAALSMKAPDALTVTGYLGVKMLGQSFTWTKAPGDLPRCEGAPPPA